MRRAALSLVLLALFAGGCTTYVYERAYDADYYRNRVEDDVRRYVAMLDYELDLSPAQERRIERLLESRTRHLLANTHVRRHDRVYPFPRRRHGRVARDWWRDADRHIGRVLQGRLADRYFDLIRTGRVYDDGRYDGRYDDHGDGRRHGR